MSSAADRELLELAAKAVGWQNVAWEQDKLRVETGGLIGHNPEWFYWNPLADDGEALRLAAALDLSVCFNYIRVSVNAPSLAVRGIFTQVPTTMRLDMAGAGRLAIVRAAAEIGRSL